MGRSSRTTSTRRLRSFGLALGRLQAAAEKILDERADAWRAAQKEVAAFAEAAGPALEGNEQAKKLKKARKWLLELSKTLRAERFEPIAAKAQRVWEVLRQSSHVSLDRGHAGGRREDRSGVRLAASVDDVEGPALAVMSQGELNALGLALFLPRATSEASPFRFLVIDDPVQAMDPHKVDGLAELLSEIARERQVVVFTHDPRLAEATRRMRLPATVLEVDRAQESVVSVRRSRDPVEQALADAWRVVKEGAGAGADAGGGAGARATVGQRLEAAAVERVRRRRLGNGQRHADVEEALEEARGVHNLVSLALFDEEGRKVVPKLVSTPVARVGRRASRRSSRATERSVDGHGSWEQLIRTTKAVADMVRNA